MKISCWVGENQLVDKDCLNSKLISGWSVGWLLCQF